MWVDSFTLFHFGSMSRHDKLPATTEVGRQHAVHILEGSSSVMMVHHGSYCTHTADHQQINGVHRRGKQCKIKIITCSVLCIAMAWHVSFLLIYVSSIACNVPLHCFMKTSALHLVSHHLSNKMSE
jgi:D-serine deaminase-like pyridoxal phosphate-dependent protein